MNLHPTKNRLKLLRAAAAGELAWYPRHKGDSGDTYWNGAGDGLLVNQRVAEQQWAGWVELGPVRDNNPARLWQLTDHGRQALEGGAR